MRDGQQNQSIRYEVKLHTMIVKLLCRILMWLYIDYFSLNLACITHEMKIVLHGSKRAVYLHPCTHTSYWRTQQTLRETLMHLLYTEKKAPLDDIQKRIYNK